MRAQMPSRVYRDFLRFVLQYARPDRRQTWREVIGLLFGRFENNIAVITDVFRPPSDKYATFVKIGDYSFISDLMVEKLEVGEYIIGWIHSHPGFGLFLSNTDVETQHLYETMDVRTIAIVVDQTLIQRGEGQNGSGMRAFKLDPTGGYQEIPLEIQDINDFRTEYNVLAAESAGRILEEALGVYNVDMSPRPTVNIDNITFKLVVPETVANQEKFRVKLQCKILEPSRGKLALDFGLHVKNATMVTHQWKRYHSSFIPRRSGTIALFSLVAKAGPGENAMINLTNLETTSGGKKTHLGDLSKMIKVT
ncbi:MAG: hypothetical protein ACXAEU_12325 [Candidatus Hodarchaeales archaeon]